MSVLGCSLRDSLRSAVIGLLLTMLGCGVASSCSPKATGLARGALSVIRNLDDPLDLADMAIGAATVEEQADDLEQGGDVDVAEGRFNE